MTASSITSWNNYEPHQLEQILSLLHDQRECITLRTIMLELTVCRGVARSILDAVVSQCCRNNNNNDDDDNNKRKYHVVRMAMSTNDNNRRHDVELVAGVDGDNLKGRGGIFSISLAIPEDDVIDQFDNDEDDVDMNAPNNANHPLLERLVAAHEIALATQREKITSGNVRELLDIFCDFSILPAPDLCGDEINDQGRKMVRRVQRSRDFSSTGSAPAVSSTSSKSKISNAKFGSTAASKMDDTILTSSLSEQSNNGKPTTAAAFFGAHQAKKATTKNKVSTSNIKSIAKATEKSGPTNDVESEEVFMDSPTEKENKSNKSHKVKTVSSSSSSTNYKGSADDFVGDIDEDDDFVESENARKARIMMKDNLGDDENVNSGATKRSKSRRRTKVTDVATTGYDDSQDGVVTFEDDQLRKSNEVDETMVEYDDVIDVKKTKANAQAGAMDAFTKKIDHAPLNNNGPTGISKKRRKKMVEQTTIDKNGYMCTETVTVWEDVDDEEEREIQNITEPTAAKTSGKGPIRCSATSKNTTTKEGGGTEGKGQKKQAGLMGFFAKKK